jgi:hypothetical protein
MFLATERIFRLEGLLEMWLRREEDGGRMVRREDGGGRGRGEEGGEEGGGREEGEGRRRRKEGSTLEGHHLV